MKMKTEEIIVLGDLWEDNGHSSAAGRVYSGCGCCPTIGASHFDSIKHIIVYEETRTVGDKESIERKVL